MNQHMNYCVTLSGRKVIRRLIAIAFACRPLPFPPSSDCFLQLPNYLLRTTLGLRGRRRGLHSLVLVQGRILLSYLTRLSEFSSSRFETECSEARSSTIGSTRVRSGLLVSSSIS